MGLSVGILGHFWLLPRWGKFIPCTGSPNTPPPSCFYPFKSVPLSLNAYRETGKITQEQAEEKLEWLNANPDVKAGFQKKGMHRFLHSKGEGKGDWHRKRFK